MWPEDSGEFKHAIESMTGLEVTRVNVHVQGISFDTQKMRKQKRSLAR